MIMNEERYATQTEIETYKVMITGLEEKVAKLESQNTSLFATLNNIVAIYEEMLKLPLEQRDKYFSDGVKKLLRLDIIG